MNEESGATGTGGQEIVPPRTGENEATGAPDAHGTTPAARAEELTRVRDLVLRAHPDVVPDLVRGSSIDELIASVEPARSAYQAVADRVRGGQSQSTTVTAAAGATVPASGETTVVVQPPVVPAGGGAANTAGDTGGLSPEGKIARALAERRK